jgi:HD-like signal output (HDOD) protein
MKLTIEKLFDQIHKVPQVPDVVRTLITQLNDSNSRYDDIAKNVEKEQVISMKVLRLVNSAHFGLSKKVGSIDDALVMLGMSQLKTLVIASGIVSSMPDIPNFNIKDFWSDSFRTATSAKWLAEQCKLENVDMIFTAGLISGLGNMLIHLGDPKVGNEIDQHVKAGEFRPDFERKRLGFTSQEACAELCRRWHFAEDLVDTVAKEGEPLSFDEVSLPACAVFIARHVSESVHSNLNEEEKLAAFPVDVWKKLGLQEQTISANISTMLTLESKLDGLAD